MIRYFHPGDEDQLAAQAPIAFDENYGWWAGVQRCAVAVAIAATLAIGASSTAQASAVFEYHQDDPAGKLFGQPDEDFWQNPVAPVPAGDYQRLPYGSLLDPEELPAGKLSGQPDEDFWRNPVAPVPASNYQRLPYGSLLDPEELPAGKLSGQPDEDFWQNSVPPVAATLGRLHLPDPEELSAGFLVAPLSPDDDFCAYRIQAPTWWTPSLFSSSGSIPPPPVAPLDEDYWQNPAPRWPSIRPLVFLDDDVVEQPAPPTAVDEDFYSLAAPPEPVWSLLLFLDDGSSVTSFQPDEDFWQNAVAPVYRTLGKLYLPDLDEIPAGALRSEPDEDFWQSSVAPVQPWTPIVFHDDDVAVPQPAPLSIDEDLWIPPRPQQIQQAASVLGATPDDFPSIATVIDEDPWIPPRPQQIQPAPKALGTADDFPSFATVVDEDYWINPLVAPKPFVPPILLAIPAFDAREIELFFEPSILCSLGAAVRPAFDSLGAAVRPGLDSLGAAVRPGLESLYAVVRPSS